jgi:HlyD family secretion protein
VGLGATAFATAWFYRIDEVITVQGRLVPKDGGVQVRSPVSGQLARILVVNGEVVQAGQRLLLFDVKAARTEEQTLSEQLALENTRLQEQLDGNLTRQATANRNISLTEDLLSRLRPLEQGGAISEVQMLQQANQLETQRDQLQQLRSEYQQLINDSRSRRRELEGRLQQVRNQLRNEVVRSPISGVVFDLQPDNDQYVAQNAEPLLRVVPGGALGGEVNVSNQDIGFIRPGQPVRVRVDAFPFTEYGEIPGEVSRVGADALHPTDLVRFFHFPVDLQLERSELKTRDGKVIPLQAGMTITTNLKLRDRRLIELLSDLFTNRADSIKRLRQP